MVKTGMLKSRSVYFPNRMMAILGNIMDYPLTIVEAPMGYGKTTAVREAMKVCRGDVHWQNIYDSSTAIFWTSFCKIFREIDIEKADCLLQLGFPNDSVTRQEALSIIDAVALPMDIVLVIDDYHIVECPEINAFITCLIRNQIAKLHIVLTVRYTNFHNLDELKLKGYLYHIKKETFEFDTKEIKVYYRVCGIKLGDAEVEKLYLLTEGWISALYLLMLNYLEYGVFTNSDDIYALVEKTLYIPFSDEIKGFLQTICFFDSFTLEQAIHMSQNKAADRLLSEIIRKNTLITYDQRTKSYHIHNLFSKLLVEQFNGRPEPHKTEIYQRVANWHLKVGEYFHAMHYFFLAKDYDHLMDVVEADKGKSIHHGNGAVFIHYFEECPTPIKDKHPIALLVYAINLFLLNEYERLGTACGEFVEGVQKNTSLSVERRNVLMGEFELLLSFTAYNDIMKMLGHIQTAAALLKQPATFIETKEGWTFGAPSVLYMFYREKGTLERDVQNIKKALPDYSRITNGHGTGGDSVMEAEWHFYRGDLEDAEIIAHRAFYTAKEHEQYDIMISAMFLQTRIALFKGTYSLSHNIFKDLHDDIARKKHYNFMHMIELCDTFIRAGLKINRKNPEWIENGEFESSRLFYPSKAFLNIVYGRVLLAKGEYLKLLASTERFMELASVFPNLLGQLYTYIYLAAANEKIYRRVPALEALKCALDIAQTDHVYMPFVENGEYIGSLLEDIKGQGLYTEAIKRIQALYETYRESLKKILGDTTSSEPNSALTERETVIAKLAGEGLSNKQISEKLFVSQNTVKTQLKRVFEKLEITSRAMLKMHFE